MELSREPTAGVSAVGDPYLPAHGDGGYRVEHYDLDLDYGPRRTGSTGRAVLTAVADTPLSRFSLDLAGVPGRARCSSTARPARFTHRGGKLRVTPARPVRGAAFTVEVRYAGTARPVAQRTGATSAGRS